MQQQVARQEGAMLERESELSAIADALEAAARGNGRLVAVRGPAGVGKSRLLDAVSGLAAERGVKVLSARGRELEREFPFGVALQLFEPAIPADRRKRDEVFAGAAALSAPLFGGEWPVAGRDEEGAPRFSLIHGLHWLATNLAEETPLALVVDDVQWADAPTIRLLIYMAQRVGDLPIAMVVSRRSGEPGTDPALAGQLDEQPSAVSLAPAPLSAEASGAVVQGAFPGAAPEFCAAAHEVTGGNPFLLREVLREVAEGGPAPDAEGARRIGELAPQAVSLAALAQLARLPGRTEGLARALAVLGDGAELRHVAGLAGLDLQEAARLTDGMAAAELIRSEPRLSFVHPLIRTAVYEGIGNGERSAAHLEAALMLRSEGAAPDRVASHLLLSPPAGSPWVVQALREAAALARERGAPDSAATFLRRALEEPPLATARAEVLLDLGRAELGAGESGGTDHMEEALSLIEDDERRARVLFLLGRRLAGTGRWVEATDRLEEGLAIAERLGDEELTAQLEAGVVAAGRLDARTRNRAIERFASLRERPAGRGGPMERVTMGVLAFELAALGLPHTEVIQLAERSLAGGDLLDQEETDGLAFYSASAALGYADRLNDAVTHFDAAVEDARRRGSMLRFARACVFRSLAQYRRGRLDDAIADASSAIDAARLGVDGGGPAPNAVLAHALLDRNDISGAAATLDIPDAESRWANAAPYGYFLAARGRLRARQGDAAGALGDYRACGELLGELKCLNPAFIPWRSGAALAAARTGDRDEAVRLADEELELARSFGANRPIGLALRARGLVEPRGQGVELLREAVEALEQSPSRLTLARTLADLGSALRRAGKRTEGREPLRQALDLAHRCGATAVAELARDELKASGGRPRRRELHGRAALTPSERRVAKLAAEGRTNREIAEALFVTPKTVEWHLGNAYRKLQAPSREELARTLAEDGLEA